MSVIIVEPTNLAFNLSLKKYQSEEEELRDFKRFMMNLTSILYEFKKYKSKIGLTSELYGLLISTFPMLQNKQIKNNEYKQLAIIAKELLNKTIPKYIKVVHEYSQHNYEINIGTDSVNKANNLLDTEIYFHWTDLLGIKFHQPIIPWCLKSNELSVFNSNSFYIYNNNKQREKFYLAHNVQTIINSKEVQIIHLVNKASILGDAADNIVSCSGTGTHGSMWGHSINSIDDIPSHDRAIFKTLIKIGFVTKILLLEFNKRYSPSNPPFMEIKQVHSYAENEVVKCIYRGRGSKQNGQVVHLYIKKGFGRYFDTVFENRISIENLIFLVNEVAYTRQNT